MAENQVSIIPNFEAICREAAGIKISCALAHGDGHRDDPTVNDICGDLTDISIELDNDDAMGVIDDFVQHIKGHDDPAPLLCNLLAVFLLASARQQTANVKERPAAMSREKRKRRVKFVPPPAKILTFNLEGKAVEDIDFRDDCAYLAKKGFSFPASSAHLVPHMQQMDWMKENLSKTDEELQKAWNDLWASPNRPRWMDRMKAEQESPNKPTPPAA
ncbi:MAG: hypothetical protein WBQ03_13330 [Candidatus Sulfotelmatobacter sp.]